MVIEQIATKQMAIMTMTTKGGLIAKKLKKQFGYDYGYGYADIYAVKEDTADMLAKLFNEYRVIVCVFSLGIVVRLISPLIKDKRSDPAIICVDEHAFHAISVLSGHFGEANRFSKEIARVIGATPVITTSSDVQQTISVDILGRALGWTIEESTFANIKRVSADVVDGKKVALIQESGEKNWGDEELGSLSENIYYYHSFTEFVEFSKCSGHSGHSGHLEHSGHSEVDFFSSVLMISDRTDIPLNNKNINQQKIIIYRPKSLVVGIGCDRNTPEEAIVWAIEQTFEKYFLSLTSIRTFASIDLKQDEVGLIKAVSHFNSYCRFYSAEELDQLVNELALELSTKKDQAMLNLSDRVKALVGTPSVAEAAALKEGKLLIVSKQKYFHSNSEKNITVAVARDNFPSPSPKHFGELLLVGIGPGEREQMTLKAIESIKNAQVIVGHHTYLKLIEPLITHQQVVASSMKQEMNRAKLSIELASTGKRVALISSGDAGIYGMAPLVYELLAKSEFASITGMNNIKVTVVPGVSAVQSSASLVGAPLGHDFCTISLSNLLTPWEKIANAIKAAAIGDFVIAFYNPSSNKRRNFLAMAVEIIRENRGNRSATTPVAIVKNAYRYHQQYQLTTLENLLNYGDSVDMFTTIIIGNSQSYLDSKNSKFITPRGHLQKYASFPLSAEASSEELNG